MMTASAIGSALALGLAGSLHCLGMCGPLALALPVGRNTSTGSRAIGRLLYNVGRACTYAVMGIFAGLFGRVLQLAGLQQAVSILLGVLLLATVFLRVRHMPEKVLRYVYYPVQRGLSRMLNRGSHLGLFQIGLLNGLLPCGLVYAALAAASLQTGAAAGAAFMFLFGIGTLPLMFVLSFGSIRFQTPRWQPLFNRLIPAVTCAVAVLLILRGLSLGIPYLSPDLHAGGTGCCPQ